MDADLDSYIKDKGIKFPGRGRGRGRATGRRGMSRGSSFRGQSQRRGNFGGVSKRPAPFSAPLMSSAVLHIANLDFGVTDQDINELFSEFGAMKKYAVHFDRSGRSLGTAEVHYTNGSSAQRAMKQYNNVPLDGRPMKITMSGGQPRVQPRAAPMQRSPRRGNQMRGGNFRSRGGRGGGGGGQKRGPPPSKEDLDADLESYKSSK